MWGIESRKLQMLKELTDLTGERETAEEILRYLKKIEEEEAGKRRQIQREGIQKAREQGVPLGRPKKKLPENSEYIFRSFLEGDFTAGQAAYYCDIGVSTLYRRVKEWERENNLKTEKGEENSEEYRKAI